MIYRPGYGGAFHAEAMAAMVTKNNAPETAGLATLALQELKKFVELCDALGGNQNRVASSPQDRYGSSGPPPTDDWSRPDWLVYHAGDDPTRRGDAGPWPCTYHPVLLVEAGPR